MKQNQIIVEVNHAEIKSYLSSQTRIFEVEKPEAKDNIINHVIDKFTEEMGENFKLLPAEDRLDIKDEIIQIVDKWYAQQYEDNQGFYKVKRRRYE